MATGRRGKAEGSIYRRRDGQWVGSVDLGLQGARRRRKTVYGKTQKDVRDKLRVLQRTVNAGALPAPANLTVERYLEDWLSRFLPGTVSPRTEVIYRNAIDRYVVPTVGSVKLHQLSPAHVSEMLLTLEAQGYAPETRRIARAVLRRALRRAEQEGFPTRNVAAIADGVKIPRREGRTLTPEQAQAFLREVKGDRLEAAYVVALALGLRRGELLGISWDDLKLDDPMPVVRIRRQLLRQQRARRPAGRSQDCRQPSHVASLPTPRRAAAGPPSPSERRGASSPHLAQPRQPRVHLHHRNPARSQGIRSHGAENLQAGRPRALEHPRVAPLVRLTPPRHGRAARGRLRHAGTRLHPSDDGRLRPPAGAITDACGRGDAPGLVDRRAARLRPIGCRTGYKPDQGRPRQRSELGFSGPPGSRSRHLGIKRAVQIFHGGPLGLHQTSSDLVPSPARHTGIPLIHQFQ